MTEVVADRTGWRGDWRIRTLVLGAGRTGFSVADTLLELGADVLVAAETIDADTRGVLEVIGARMLEGPLAKTPHEVIDFAPELVIVSPGIAPHHAVVTWAHEFALPVWGDVELAWRLRDKVPSPATGEPAEWIVVTGTNGKTTTVQLTAAMLEAAGHRVAACGNLGVPVLDAIRDPGGFDALVIELSSFQLHYAHSLSPWASACLNVADDHLDWHGGVNEYRAAKASVYERTRVACVYNLDDPATRGFVEEADVIEGARAVGFGLGVPGPSDFGVVDGILCDRAFLDDRRNTALEITTLDELETRGLARPHHVANVLAASALARSFGAGIDAVRDAALAFRPDRHRTEVVLSAHGIEWIDDSKATNAHAAEAALRAFDSIVWIAGGLFKGANPDALVERVSARLRAAVIIGSDRALLRAAFERHAPALPVVEVDEGDTDKVMRAAVRIAAGFATSGDTVLLAPAAASMDQFRDYADRGDRFQAAVRELGGGESDDDGSASPAPAR